MSVEYFPGTSTATTDGVSYPVMQGLRLNVRRRNVWQTGSEEAGTGREARGTYRTRRRYRFEFEWSYLTLEQLNTLNDFFNARQGRFDTFLFVDPIDGVERTVRFDTDELEFLKDEVGFLSLPTCPIIEVIVVGGGP